LSRPKRTPVALVEVGSESAIRVAITGEVVDVRLYRGPGRRSPQQGLGIRAERLPELISALEAAVIAGGER
jgi:hypothetical protein